MSALTIILGILLGAGFAMAGGTKLAGHPRMLESRDRLGLSEGLFKIIGGLEVAGAAGVLLGLVSDLAVIGILAAVGLIAMTIGAASYHQKVDDAFQQWAPAVVMGSMAIFYIIARIASV
jgi:hypothetical protein